ncbi:MAG TPA: AAA family ATPase, partial [Thermoanaerobaculia bacterium]|nr:AAA family ATPase [Thermoanaerobaculia bacterium]
SSGMLLLPLIIEPCSWRKYLPLRNIQLLPSDRQTVTGDYAGREHEIFSAVAERISSWLTAGGKTPPAPLVYGEPLAVDVSRLPVSSVSGGDLIGRKKELQTLDEAWESYDTGVVVFVGEGGTGKSALVERWLQQMSGERFRGARRVYGWSFYSQGCGTTATSADQFLSVALDEWFGEDSTRYRSSWEKGNRLVRLLRTEPALLILDGLEPLQSALHYQRGQITDPGLARLVFELARDNPGLLVITTREAVFGLSDSGRCRGAQEERLEEMSFEDGAALLVAEGVSAPTTELRAASMELENHALALRLLAGFLKDTHGGALASLRATSALPKPPDGPAQRVMAAFAGRLGAGPELGILGLLGLFDRPCEEAAIVVSSARRKWTRAAR